MKPQLFARAALIAVSALLSVAATGAQAMVVNINATTPVGTAVTLAAGTYSVRWLDTSSGGLYSGWQYNNATSGNFREAFTITNQTSGAVTTYDRNTGGPAFSNYLSASAALADFQGATGASQFIMYAGSTDANIAKSYIDGPLTLTLYSAQTLIFSVPDYQFRDNTGGVSLAINDIPEPQSAALALAGFGAMVWATRRRRQA